MTYEKLLQYWERKFWLTEFTHLGGNGNPTRSNLVLVAKGMSESPQCRVKPGQAGKHL